MNRLGTIVSLLAFARISGAADPNEHGHGHVHAHPHPDFEHHHHPHDHPHPPGQGHHHPIDPAGVAAGVPVAPAAPSAAAAPEVTAIEPEHAAPGAEVRVRGTGFAAGAKVWMNGKALAPVSIAPTEIVVRVPAGATSDVLVVKQVGLPDAASPLALTVDSPPVVRAMRPTSAPPGTRVEIAGEHFAQGDQVLFGDKPLRVVEVRSDLIAVSSPDGPAKGPLAIVRGSTVVKTPPFTALAAPPRVTGLQPDAGPPGAALRVIGESFTPKDQVTLAGQALKVIGRGPDFLEVQTTAASKSGAIVVAGPGGKATAPTPYAVVRPAIVGAFTPTSGPPTTKVTIHGREFVASDEVVFDGRTLPVLERGATALVVAIPDGAHGDRFAIRRGPTTTPTQARFEVIYPPAIAKFTPAEGPAGTAITIEGSGFLADTKVLFGGAPLKITARAPEKLTVVAPAGSRAERFVIVTAGGQTTTPRPFDLYEYARPGTFAPTFGPAGTRVVINGKNFTPQDTVALGETAVPIASTTPETLTVTIPAGARPDRFTIVSHGRKVPTAGTFRVVAPPPPLALIFSPMSGPAGSWVTIAIGRKFSPGDTVLLGDRPVAVKPAPGGKEVRVQIPAGAATATFEVVLAGGQERVKADRPFQVTGAGAGRGSSGVY